MSDHETPGQRLHRAFWGEPVEKGAEVWAEMDDDGRGVFERAVAIAVGEGNMVVRRDDLQAALDVVVTLTKAAGAGVRGREVAEAVERLRAALGVDDDRYPD